MSVPIWIESSLRATLGCMDAQQAALRKVVANALARAMPEYTDEDLMVACNQVWAHKMTGAMVDLLEEELVDLTLVNGEVIYLSEDGPAAPPVAWPP